VQVQAQQVQVQAMAAPALVVGGGRGHSERAFVLYRPAASSAASQLIQLSHSHERQIDP
jgi:hypothetical protein